MDIDVAHLREVIFRVLRIGLKRGPLFTDKERSKITSKWCKINVFEVHPLRSGYSFVTVLAIRVRFLSGLVFSTGNYDRAGSVLGILRQFLLLLGPWIFVFSGTISAGHPTLKMTSLFLVDLKRFRANVGKDWSRFSINPDFISGGHPGIQMSSFFFILLLGFDIFSFLKNHIHCFKISFL